MVKYNPLDTLAMQDSDLLDLDIQPSRITKLLFRTSGERYSNTLQLLTGSWLPNDEHRITPEVFGALDYLGLGLPYALLRMLARIQDFTSSIFGLNYAVDFVCFWLNIPLAILNVVSRVLSSLTARILTTFLALPIILLTQPLVDAYKRSVDSKICTETVNDTDFNLKDGTFEAKETDIEVYSYYNDGIKQNLLIRENPKSGQRRYSLFSCIVNNNFPEDVTLKQYSYKDFDTTQSLQDSEIMKQVMRVR